MRSVIRCLIWIAVAYRSYADHARLMFDLQCWRYRAMSHASSRSTRARNQHRTYPEIGVPIRTTSSHHAMIRKIARMAKINQFHVSLFAEFSEIESHAGRSWNPARSLLYLYAAESAIQRAYHTKPADPRRGRLRHRNEGGVTSNTPSDPLANLHLTLLHKVGSASTRLPTAKARWMSCLSLYPFERAKHEARSLVRRASSHPWLLQPVTGPQVTRARGRRRKTGCAAIRSLLKQHVDLSAPQVDGMTALHWRLLDDLKRKAFSERRRQCEGD